MAICYIHRLPTATIGKVIRGWKAFVVTAGSCLDEFLAETSVESGRTCGVKRELKRRQTASRLYQCVHVCVGCAAVQHAGLITGGNLANLVALRLASLDNCPWCCRGGGVGGGGIQHSKTKACAAGCFISLSKRNL